MMNLHHNHQMDIACAMSCTMTTMYHTVPLGKNNQGFVNPTIGKTLSVHYDLHVTYCGGMVIKACNGHTEQIDTGVPCTGSITICTAEDNSCL
jgi:hypothetical protein